MAENQETNEKGSEGSCKSGCGCGACCVTGKVLLVALLLFIGGILGYLLAGNCRMKKMCGMMGQPCPMMAAPADHAPTK